MFKIGDIVNAKDGGSLKGGTVIDVYPLQNIVVVEYYGFSYNVYMKDLALVKHQPLYEIKRNLKYSISLIKDFIHTYNPFNYRLIHKDDYNDY